MPDATPSLTSIGEGAGEYIQRVLLLAHLALAYPAELRVAAAAALRS
jgi:hypothetical protein